MSTRPGPTSLALARWLAIPVAGIPPAVGFWLLIRGLIQTRDAGGAGPASPPDLEGPFAVLGACIVLTVASPLIAALVAATVGVWLRKRWGTITLATLCALQGAATAFLLISALNPALRPAVTLPLSWTAAYTALLLGCAAVSIKATVDLGRDPTHALGFPVLASRVPPAPLPDFEILDDSPAEEP
jgi:hypothetical protein